MFDWLRRKLKREPRAEGEPVRALPAPDYDTIYEESQRLREEKAKAEEELRQEKAAREAKARKEAEEEYAGKRPPRQKTVEEILESLPPEERKKYRKRIAEGKKAQVEAELEIWESGIPGRKRVMHRVWNPVTQQHEFKEVEVTLSPQERLAEARIQKLGGALIEEELAGLKQKRRQRSLPYRTARAAGGFGQLMAGTAMLGVAGAAQAIQPGRGGPQRAARMHAPGLPIEVYRVGTPNVSLSGLKGIGIDLSGLRRNIQPTLHLGGLEHLRGMTIPRRRSKGG